jgi:hypothetical protein
VKHHPVQPAHGHGERGDGLRGAVAEQLHREGGARLGAGGQQLAEV